MTRKIEQLKAGAEQWEKRASQGIAIEQDLRIEIERLRGALNELWLELSYMDGDKAHRLCGICKIALENKP